ncbi:unnamed protein product [Mytilus coruscus]|uniref:Endonuclease/exonuclease/phosphatase domain-containing protein n=1 Tax=Mytilus coruscus TaxID=42192 RepID=A0A6J8D947_MYTCO|nr:unnamed protein product [Mytilus coruscus]
MLIISPVIAATVQHKDVLPTLPNVTIDTSPTLQNVNVDVTTPMQNVTIDHCTIQKPPSSASNTTNNTTRTDLGLKELKQSELRQRESKLRKKEEELKIRERIIEETQTEKIWTQPTTIQPNIASESSDQNSCSEQGYSKKLNILSFNCKNLKTSGNFIRDMKQEIDIFLIQEHWLFHCELNMLSEIHDEIAGSGKAVDSGDPISASYMPRGYGGFTNQLNQQQTAKLSNCIDQLNEIVQKYKGTHEIVIGGDFNEDIVKETNNSKRKIALLEFMKECKLTTNHKGPTFINTSGADISEIDYFLHSNIDLQPSKRITDHPVNVSDHHPILLQIECYLTQHAQQTSNNQKPKIKWEKLDKQNYTDIISKEIIRYSHMLEDDNVSIDQIIKETTIYCLKQLKKLVNRRSMARTN